MDQNNTHKPALHHKHAALEAKMADVSGWQMPLSYGSVIDEVMAVRQRASVFDITHLGRIRIRGTEASELLHKVCTADAMRQEDDTAVYTLLLNEKGGILADGFIIRLPAFHVLTVAACNRDKILEHLRAAAGALDVKIDDQTEKTTHLCVCGPKASEILDSVLPMSVSDMPRGAARMGSLMIARYIALRAGFCRQWALEVMVPNMVAAQAWDYITKNAGENCIAPAGHAARDVIRIEDALPRYGHEINETTDPVTAGLTRAVDMETDFIGRDAIAGIQSRSPDFKTCGLIVTNTGQSGTIPRQGNPITAEGSEIGTVTSSTYSPALESVIAMAHIRSTSHKLRQKVSIKDGDDDLLAEICTLPFYKPGCDS